MSEKVYLVFFAKGGLSVFCGAFSTDEKAQAYINAVNPTDRVWFYSKATEVDWWS